MGNLRHWRAKHLPEVTQGDRAEAGPKTMCVGSEVRLTPMWFLWGLISIVLGVGSIWGLISIVLGGGVPMGPHSIVLGVGSVWGLISIVLI